MRTNSQQAVHDEERTWNVRAQLDLGTSARQHWPVHFSATIAERQRTLEIWALIQPQFYKTLLAKALQFCQWHLCRNFNRQRTQKEIRRQDYLSAICPERIRHSNIASKWNWFGNLDRRRTDRGCKRGQERTTVQHPIMIPQGAL